MKFVNTNSKLSTIALILILTMSLTLLASLSPVNAYTYDTHSFISARPNPTGVNQAVLVTMWVDKMPPVIADPYIVEPYPFEVTITKPDGTTIENTYYSDPVGAGWFEFYPDTVGTYYIQYHMSGISADGDTWNPSDSQKITLIVQQEQIQEWPAAELPTGYWERPIEVQNREWWKIAGDWLLPNFDSTYSNFNPYTTAPESAHIVWTKPIDFGGLVGGQFGVKQYYTGESYEGKWTPIILQGRIIYPQRVGSSAYLGTACLDLRTGEEIWFLDDVTIDAAQTLDYESRNQHGVIPYLWDFGGTYRMYDANTAELIIEIPNAMSPGQTIMDPNTGDMMVYVISSNNWLVQWNSTKCILGAQPIEGFSGREFWRPSPTRDYDWADGIEWNVTLTDRVGGYSLSSGGGNLMNYENIILSAKDTSVFPPIHVLSGVDAQTGAELWSKNFTLQEDPGAWTAGGGTALGGGVYVDYIKEEKRWFGIDVNTGDLKWITEPRTDDWGAYTGGRSAVIAYDTLYSGAYDGYIYAYDIETGDELWKFSSGNAGLETPYGTWSFFGTIGDGMSVADGKIYGVTGEHSPNAPTWRGLRMHCFDAYTGEPIWDVLGLYNNPAIADGYLTTLNMYDNQIYTFGKGQTATTVDAPLAAVPLGSSIVIRGTVTDQSPGASDTPAIADASMTEWMEYLYMQKPMPKDAEGVEVVITTLDPNGNTYELGRTTTDVSGTFGIAVDPPVPGFYKVIATFEGSDSYFDSSAVTYFEVEEATSAAQEMQPELVTSAPTETTAATQAPFITTELAIIAAIAVSAIIGVVAFWTLRKRK